MNSITKIGKMYLTKYFSKKPTFIKQLNQKWFTEVIFSNKPIQLSINPNFNFIQAYPLNYRFYKIWSGEIGMLSLDFKKDQTLLKGIVRKLNKLQKENAPSHVIMCESTQKDGIIPEVTTTYTIYRLTDSQELLIYNDYLLPCIDKRNKKLDEAYFKEQEKFEKDHLEHQKYLETCNLKEEKSLQEFNEVEELSNEELHNYHQERYNFTTSDLDYEKRDDGIQC